jgi:FAD/FMN-containing dehydrogenase
MSTPTTSLAGLARRDLAGLEDAIVGPADPGYDEARAVHNGMIDRRPALIVRCSSPEDVARTIAFARTHDVPLAVRGGGHNGAGLGVVDDGVVIDLAGMAEVFVDPASETVRVGGGATWGEVDRATAEHGRVTPAGIISTTGVGGLTLGGGIGHLTRAYGLTIDNLIGADVVLADGSQVYASADEHPDLFWALRGGGGNFGVVTAFEFRLHPIGREVFAGLALYPAVRGRELMALYRDVMRDAPEGLSLAFLYLRGPAEEEIPEHLHGELVVAIAGMYAGPLDEGAEALAEIRAAEPEVDFFGPLPYADFQCMIDDPPGYRNYWTTEHLVDLPDAAIEAIASRSDAMPAGLSQLFMVSWGGAVARVGQDASPLSARDARFVVHPFGMWEDPAGDAANIEWARGFRDDLAAFSTGAVYLNFVGDEGEARVRAGYGPGSYERLAWVKAVWDPDNVFRASGNVPPPTAVTKAA